MQVTPQSAPPLMTSANDTEMREAAKELEAVFLAEMLKSAGFGETSSEFGGGVGEEQFSSFMTQQQAKVFADNGGIGLAEHIFNAMKRQQT